MVSLLLVSLEHSNLNVGGLDSYLRPECWVLDHLMMIKAPRRVVLCLTLYFFFIIQNKVLGMQYSGYWDRMG